MLLEAEFEALIGLVDRGRLYVDIPVGLPDTERKLEGVARRQASVRAGSIFSVPCRQAVYAVSYQCACDINLTATGKKLSKQSWYLCEKIRQVDVIMRRNRSLRSRVIESHPELAYSIMNGGPLAASKKSMLGIRTRLEILSKRLPEADEIFRRAERSFPRKVLARDDIVDAIVLMVVAAGRNKRLEVRSQRRDKHGIPIRMCVPV